MTTRTASGWLQRMGLVRFAGADAVPFLQGQLSNDMRRLAQRRPLLAAYSTPQGRVIALPHLIPHSRGIIAILPRDIVASTIERLSKFVMRAKVKMEDLSEQFSVLGLLGTDSPLPSLVMPARGEEYCEHDGIGVSRLGGATAAGDLAAGATAGGDPAAGPAERFWVIGEARHLTADPAAVPAALERVDQEWRLANIRAGMPQIYRQTQEMFVAQMLNLDLIDGISFSKGCYTGQEIIARTQHLGRIKRRSLRLRLPAGAWEIGQTLQLTDGRSGRLIEIAASGAGFEALAVLNPQPGMDTDVSSASAAPTATVAAIELPLPYSLTAA